MKIRTLNCLVAGMATMLVVMAGPSSQAQSFVDVSDSAGIDGDTLTRSWGSPVWGDINNDGYLDVMVSVHGVLGTNRPYVYTNNGNGTFTNTYATSGIVKTGFHDPVYPDSGDWHGWALGDFDGDGNLDLSIVEGSRDNDFTKRDKLFKGLGNGTFSNVADSAGIELNENTGGSSFWVDFNNDGKLDLFVKNWTTSPNRLYQNNGDGTFTDVAVSAGLADYRGSNSAWADYDNDGYMDVMITGLGGLIPNPPDGLFHNNRDGTFTEVTAQAGLPVRILGKGIAWGDYNNDGNIDVFIARGASAPIPLDGSTKTSLYRNNGDGTFTEVTDQAGVGIIGNTWAAVWGDYDNDGYLDLFVANSGDNPNNNRCYLFHNNGDGTFTDVAAAEGLQLQDNVSAHKGASWADYDNDGFLDLMIKNGVGTETSGGGASRGTHRLYRNTHPGNTNNWLKINLVGVQSNRNGIGAKLMLTTKNGSQFRQNDGGGGGVLYSQSSEPIHFGLGQATQGDLQITWPSGVVDNLQAVQADQTLTVTEGQGVPAPQLFVVVSATDSVAVINSSTNQVITQIPVGRSPIRIAMTPDGRKAYVSNAPDGTLSVIDTANRVVTKTISVGRDAQELAVTPDGGRVFVVHKTSGDITVVETSTDTVIFDVAIGGSGSRDVAVSPDGRFAYVANATASMVNVIDTSTYAVTNIPTQPGPRRLLLTPTGDRLFAADYDSGFVSVIDTATQTLITDIAVASHPRGMAITPNGKEIYVTNVGAGTVSIIKNSTLAVTGTVRVGNEPWQVLITPDGAWAYVSNGGAQTLSLIDTSTHTLVKNLFVGVNPFVSIVNPGATEVYVCNSRDSTVSVVDLASQIVLQTIQVGSKPFDLLFDGPQTPAHAPLRINRALATKK
jgi:YVTN family beta-propeller protein